MIFKFVLIIITGIFIYLQIPYSPVESEYFKEVSRFNDEYKLPKSIITKEDLEVLPETLQNYFIKNGYIGIERADSIRIDFKNVDFSMGVNKRNLKIDYIVHSYTKEPIRLAFIDSKLYTIPFQGIDLSKDGKASMKGVLGKHITLFNTSFEMIDSAYLSECLLHPSLALQENISYREIDKYKIEATLRKNQSEVKGVFHFNEDYKMTKFVDENRFSQGTDSYEKWSAVPSEYKLIDGINRPTRFQAIWHYKDKDLIYFDGRNMEITYN